MNKASIFLMAALALGFTACDDTSDLGVEQKPTIPTVVTVDGLKFGLGEDIADLNLNLNEAAGKDIKVISFIEGELPAATTLSYQMELSANEDYSAARTIDVTDGAVPASAIEDAFKAFYGAVESDTKPIYVRFITWLTTDTPGTTTVEKVRLGGTDYYVLDGTALNVTPVEVKLPTELYTPGANGDWNFTDADMIITTTDYVTYQGYVAISGE